ncbi:MAG: CPBP family intramembrane metalloprotease [Candidatus Lokiarchaeota archaeon]|nr:CPBP family intramembrane metalloprotease [Candidatus Lokiarchaeota archaeon]
MTRLKQILQEKPIIGGIVVAALFNLFLFLALLTQTLIYIAIGDMHFFSIILLQFSLMFGFLAILFLLIVPYGLNLPNGVNTLGEYSEAIQLKDSSSLKHNVILGLIVVAVFVAFELVAGLVVIQISFNFVNLFMAPQPDNLGSFSWVYNLRPGIWEEVAFRGVILTMLLKKYSKRTSIIIDGVLFGLIHLMNLLFGADLLSTVVQIVYATILGFFLAYMYVKTESIVSCVITHYLIDVFGQMFIISGMSILTYFVIIVGLVVSIPVMINSYLVKIYSERFLEV